MDNFSITKNGKPLSKNLYSINTKAKTFTTEEGGLVLDFNILNGWTFTTGYSCTFEACEDCTFITGADCIFHTVGGCTFTTGKRCVFKTSRNCTFYNGKYCTFLIQDIQSCKFKTYDENSIILDCVDGKRYVLNDDFLKLMKMMKG